MNGDFVRVLQRGQDGLGYFHSLPDEMQICIFIYAEEQINQVSVDHRNALQSAREHATKRHEEDRKKYERIAEKNYGKELKLWNMLGMAEAWMTKDQINEALVKMTRKDEKLKAVKQQLKMWHVGAGWKDCHVAFSRGNVKFTLEHLVEQLKEILRNHVSKSRPIRACPPPPFASAKPLPEIGETL